MDVMSEDVALRPGQPLGPALSVTARELLAKVGLSETGTEAEAIHDFRRAVKRWRAFLRLAEPIVGESARTLRDEARDIARNLAGARDAQAALDALNDLGEDYAVLTPRTLATVTKRLEDMRASAEQKTLTPEIRDKLQAMQAATTAAVGEWPLDTVHFRDVAKGLTTGYRRARNAIPEDWTTAAPEALHEFRQRVVVHRYQMELAEPAWPRLGKVWVSELQRLRDRLGKHQDLTVLTALTQKGQPLARWRKPLIPAIEARRRDHIEMAMRLAGRLFAERPQDFQRRVEAMWEP
jgi:CHAD domain-containing protein